MSDESVDLVVSDPPYLMNYQSNHRKEKGAPIMNDTSADKGMISEYIRECYRVLKKHSAAYIVCNYSNQGFFVEEARKAGFKLKNAIVWDKGNWTAGDLEAAFGCRYEVILLLNKGRKKFHGKRLADIWSFPRVSWQKAVHQNPKPLELIEQCIKYHSDEGDVVLDGFMGSGTTAVACVKTGRHFVGWELDPKFYTLATERVEAAKRGA